MHSCPRVHAYHVHASEAYVISHKAEKTEVCG